MEEVQKKFRENFEKLRTYLDKFDFNNGENSNELQINGLKKILGSYSEISKSQTNTIKSLYAPFIAENTINPLETYKTISESEIEKMWDSINRRKDHLEISNKILVFLIYALN